MRFVKQPLILHTLLILFGIQRLVTAGRKGAGGGGDGRPQEEEPTEIPTSEYFFDDVDNEELLRIYSVVEGSHEEAIKAAEDDQSRYKNDRGNIELCTYCREEVGNSTTDVECQDNSRELCWSSAGCYRLTFTDHTTQLYHIEKGCWNERFTGMFGMCMKKCNIKRDGLPSPDKRINCYCELCHGPMCNRELLISGVSTRSGVGMTVLTALLVHMIGL